jgi:hypothetical protein
MSLAVAVVTLLAGFDANGMAMLFVLVTFLRLGSVR